jgi:hypothetical protein
MNRHLCLQYSSQIAKTRKFSRKFKTKIEIKHIEWFILQTMDVEKSQDGNYVSESEKGSCGDNMKTSEFSFSSFCHLSAVSCY